MFKIRMGIPEIKSFWDDLLKKCTENTANKDEQLLFKKFGNCLRKLSTDSRYPGLKSHEIDELTNRYGMKVWESYLENKTSGAMRIFWVYGPDREDITIIGLEPHPNDKKDVYEKIVLSGMEQKEGK